MLESHLKNETTEEMKIYIKKLQEENKMLQANLYSANQEINELIEAEKKGNSKHIPINGTFHLIEWDMRSLKVFTNNIEFEIDEKARN